jgi:hypothetical protein
MHQLSGREFEIGLTISGAISARDYAAGTPDFPTEAFDARKDDDGDSVPNHRVGFKIMSGAIGPAMAAMKRFPRQTIALATLLAFFLIAPVAALASDHADPLEMTDPNGNLTDLFFFPKGDQYILIVDVHAKLTSPKPYDLGPYEYKVNFDLTTPLAFTSDEDRSRYGGTITAPDKIHPDASITIHLNNDATLKDLTVNGLNNTDKIRTYTGVRDDPFIFPRFFKVNVIAMVMSIPKNAFPAEQHDFMLWATSSKDGVELDHDGRSIRTQLPRFSEINTSPPSEHVKLLMQRKETVDNIYNFLKNKKEWYSRGLADLIQTSFLIRKYDLVPDVMIYTDRFPVGYPNGRVLTDDVVAQTCAFGDCLLQEISYIEGGYPRATENDKRFLDDWPYLADPWPERPEAGLPTESILPYIVGAVLVFAFVSWAIIEILRRLLVWVIWRPRSHAASAA